MVVDIRSDMSRLELLQTLDILDSEAEPAFDALVQMASLVCACPISLVSLTDIDRQWFKARIGLDATEAPRDQAFCTYAVRGSALMEVPDATRDERFSDNPLVTGDSNLRFYAGQPILYDGVPLGTLCVIDRVPRELDATQRAMLEHLSVVLADLLHGRMEARLHRREQQRLRDFAHLSGDWLWETDLAHRCTWRSTDGEDGGAVTSFSGPVLGKCLQDFEILDRFGRAAVGGPRLHSVLDRYEAFSDVIVSISGPTGHRLVALTAGLMHDAAGEITGFRGSSRDVTARIAAEVASHERESAIRKIAGQIPGMIYQFGVFADGRVGFPYVSEGIRDVFEIAPESAQKEASVVSGRVHSADFAAVRASIEISRETGAVWHARFRVQLPVKGIRWLQGSAIPERRADGSTVWHGYLTDVTESHARDRELADAHAALVVTERRLRAVTDNLPALISYVDRDGRYRYVNAHYRRILGIDAALIVGRTMRETHDAATYANIESPIRDALVGRTSTFEGSKTVDGALLHYHGVLVPDFAADGSVAGFYAMTFDLTRQKAAELRLAARERLLRGVTDNLPGLVSYVGMDNRYQFANATYARWLGVDHHTMIGKRVDEFFGPDDIALMSPYVARAQGGERVSYERRSTQGGRTTHYQVDYAPDIADDGSVLGLYSLTTDITARREAELRLVHRERRLRDLTDALPVLIYYVEADLRVSYANETFCRLLGAQQSDIIDHSLVEVLGEDMYEQRRGYLRRGFAGERVSFEVDSTIMGFTRHVETTYLPDIGPEGRVVGLTSLSVDVTDRILAEKRLSHLAHFDTLTELPNRLHFNNRLAASMAQPQRDGATTALMFLDIDHFKTINDTLGHGVGDLVLKEFARRVLHSVRPTDLVARLAGDEFVVLLDPLHHVNEARLVAQKILDAVDLPFFVDGTTVVVTTSVGIALCDERPCNTVDMLAKADAALYRAKEAGRNTFAIAA